MSEFVSEVGDGSFEQEVLQSPMPVLVDFWAEWCAPCRRLAPTVDKVAEEFEGQLKVVKVNVDNSASVSSRFGIKSIPTLILFKDGTEQDRMIGDQTREAITRMVGRFVA
jgi:thioredoxin 1